MSLGKSALAQFCLFLLLQVVCVQPVLGAELLDRQVVARVETDAFDESFQIEIARDSVGAAQSFFYTSSKEGEKTFGVADLQRDFQVVKVFAGQNAVLLRLEEDFDPLRGGHGTLRFLINGIAKVYRNFRIWVEMGPLITLRSDPDFADPDSDRNAFTGNFNHLFMRKATIFGFLSGIKEVVPSLVTPAKSDTMVNRTFEMISPHLTSKLPSDQVLRILDDPYQWARTPQTRVIAVKPMSPAGGLWAAEVTFRTDFGYPFRVSLPVQETVLILAEGRNQTNGDGFYRRYEIRFRYSSTGPDLTTVKDDSGWVMVHGSPGLFSVHAGRRIEVSRPVQDPLNDIFYAGFIEEFQGWVLSLVQPSSSP